MAISFNTVPSNLRINLFAAEFDSSRASQGPAALPYRALIVGQKIAAGSAVADSIVRCSTEAQAIALAGRGSQLHLMFRAFNRVNKFTEVYLGVLADNGAGVAATKTLTVTGPATAAGTISLYVGGELVQVGVASGDAQNAIAAAINVAVNAKADLPVTTTVGTNVVTTLGRNKGVASQDLDVRINYQDGEALPAGVSIAKANVVSGITNPVLTGLISTMGDTWFHIIAHPYYDATSLTALETELASRFGPTRMIDGLAITSAPGTQSTLGTLGDSRNSPHSVIAAQPGENPLTQPCEFASAVAGAVAAAGSIDPARPFQTLPLSGVKAPVEADMFQAAERNLELYDGISTSRSIAGVVQIERIVTTFQLNAGGQSDVSYLDATTMLTLMYLRYSWRNRMVTKYPRHKLASDDARVGSGQAVITPKIGRAEALAWFRQMETLGLVEGFDQFKTDLVVERDATDVNRMNWLVSPDLVNQFIVGATKFLFLL